MKLSSLSLLLLSSYALAGVLRDERVIDGELWQDRAIPYLVSVSEDGAHICGGFIYNKDHVITAASCVDKKAINTLKVVVNQFSLVKPDTLEEEVPAFKVTIKPDYDRETKANDIAVIQLAREINLIPFYETKAEQPGPSCVRYDEVLGGEQSNEGTFAGWGATEIGGLGSTKLHYGKVNLLANAECVKSYPDFKGASQICAENLPNSNSVKTGPCLFDEGGPLVVEVKSTKEPVVVGIYSFNTECKVETPSVYTRLSTHYAWIGQVAGAQPSDCFASGPVPTVDPGETTSKVEAADVEVVDTPADDANNQELVKVLLVETKHAYPYSSKRKILPLNN